MIVTLRHSVAAPYQSPAITDCGVLFEAPSSKFAIFDHFEAYPDGSVAAFLEEDGGRDATLNNKLILINIAVTITLDVIVIGKTSASQPTARKKLKYVPAPPGSYPLTVTEASSEDEDPPFMNPDNMLAVLLGLTPSSHMDLPRVLFVKNAEEWIKSRQTENMPFRFRRAVGPYFEFLVVVKYDIYLLLG